LDNGDRMARTTANAGSVLRMQPVIAKMILDSESLKNPGVTFALFNWATSGGVVMDYLISRITEIDPTSDKVLIGTISPKIIQSQFMISSAHLKRLLKQATELGSVGWAGAPGKSSFWLSRNFVSEYWNYQAEKYAIVDAVSQAVLDQPDNQAKSSEEFHSRALAISA